ncbi:hypothetical protein M9H77_36241 [Catharanthus roseus]|uniref:Uncharacterized protein n=1 Tax=Catharanthus roseus TaxID=4058 RepID=A0ACB9ZSJ4_CATRO|nr:hypothetical protein M9H77_36241 [Catharanthus roseus]
MSFVYKILMNSLYGRFGISPKSTKTKIRNEIHYKYLLRKPDFIFGALLDENTYIVSYHDEPSHDSWNPMKNVIVQLAAAITPSARMYMYPYTSREDSYYRDTDSVVLVHALPEERVSSSVLGKIDWYHMNIIRKETLVRLGSKLGTKRGKVFKDDLHADTKEIEEWKYLRECFAKESCGVLKGFPLGVFVLIVLHLIVEEGRGGTYHYCSCYFLFIYGSRTQGIVHSHSLVKNGSSPRMTRARERVCISALTKKLLRKL